MSGLTDADWRVIDPASKSTTFRLYLWVIYGRTAPQDPEPTLFGLRGQGGLDAFRRVRDLLPQAGQLLAGPPAVVDEAMGLRQRDPRLQAAQPPREAAHSVSRGTPTIQTTTSIGTRRPQSGHRSGRVVFPASSRRTVLHHVRHSPQPFGIRS